MVSAGARLCPDCGRRRIKRAGAKRCGRCNVKANGRLMKARGLTKFNEGGYTRPWDGVS